MVVRFALVLLLVRNAPVVALAVLPGHLPLPLAPAGTHFQRKVWDEIATIPPGHTTSYGELAKAIRSGPRAIGGACGANPYPVVVPCHRVIAATGGLGGFAKQRDGFLLDVKSWLLEHEHTIVD